MASQVNVWAELTAVGLNITPGSTQYWQTTGLGYGRYVSYVAHPLQLSDTKLDDEYEVHNISHEVDAAGNRRVLFQVTSKGSDAVGFYGLFLVFTDVIP